MWLVLSALVVALLSAWFFFSRKPKHPVDLLPGPPSLPIIGTTLNFVKGREAAFRIFNEMAEKFYPIYRTQQGAIRSAHPLDPRDLEIILTSNIHISKSHDYNFLKDWLGTGLLISTGAKWHSRRKLLTPAFHFSILEQFVPVFCDKTRTLIEKLRSAASENPDGVNIVPYVTRCALDIICQTAMGTELHAQDSQDSPYVASVYEVGEIVIDRLVRPWLYPNWIFKRTSLGRKQEKCLKILHDFTKKVIKERREELQKLKVEGKIPTGSEPTDDIYFGGKKRKFAFLDLLIKASENDPTLTDEDIREEVDTFMFEGHDTTAMAMSWTIYFLGKHIEVQSRCVEELEEIFCGSDRNPNLTDLGNMKYLERVIKESLRLRPSVLSVGRMVHQPLKLTSHDFPAGTRLNLHIYNVHRNPEIYPDPEKFDPDRFLPENCVGRHPYAYIPFSAGPRNCIGQRFAMLEMKEVLSTMLRHFRLETIDPEHHYEALPDLILRPKYGISLRLFPRETS